VAIVHLPSGWTQHTGGLDEILVDAPRVQEMIAALVERYPGLAGPLEHAAVAIDGKVYHHARYEPLYATSDVHLLPPVSGG
jgi:molybdopterin converting factor small subunit